MSEQELLTECAKEVAKEVYQDAGKPVAKPTGELMGLIPRAIKAALLPIEKWIVDREYNLAETKKLLEQRLANISPEQIEAPEAHIAVPALQYISYCMDNEELRNMYANLLASSMNKVVKNDVHPAFIEIIKQLCPDEAKILKHFHVNKIIPIISIGKKAGMIFVEPVIDEFSDIGECTECENPHHYKRYFNNLERLGLIEKNHTNSINNDNFYDKLMNHEFIRDAHKKLESNVTPTYVKSFIRITPFGEFFCSICLSS